MAWSTAAHSSKIGDGFILSWSSKTGDGVNNSLSGANYLTKRDDGVAVSTS